MLVGYKSATVGSRCKIFSLNVSYVLNGGAGAFLCLRSSPTKTSTPEVVWTCPTCTDHRLSVVGIEIGPDSVAKKVRYRCWALPTARPTPTADPIHWSQQKSARTGVCLRTLTLINQLHDGRELVLTYLSDSVLSICICSLG